MSNVSSNRIEFLLNARDNASSTMRNAAREMANLDKAAGVLAGGLSALAVSAGVSGLMELAQSLDELGRRGAIFNQIGDVFQDFAGSVGSDADLMLDAMKKAAAGTISEFELILNANRALQFEVAKTPEQLAQLIELSTALGRAQGISDTQALEFITTGIARRSRLILDNLGLIIDMNAAEEAYAATLGKTADELSNAEKNAAILAEAYRQGAVAIAANKDAADSAATQYERLDANITNLKDTLGELIALAAADKIGAFADSVAELVDRIRDPGSTTLGKDIEQLEKLRDRLKDQDDPIYSAFGPEMDANPEIVERLNAVLEDGRQTRLKLLATEQLHNTSMQEAATLSMQAADAFSIQANAAAAAEARLAAEAEATAKAGREAALAAIDVAVLSDALDKLAGGAASAIVSGAKSIIPIVGAQKAQEIAEAQLRTLQEQTLEMQKQGVTGLDLVFGMEELRLQTTGVFTDIRETDAAAKRAAQDGIRAMEKAAGDAERAFEDLKGKVAGVLSGALDPGVGVDPDQILADLGLRPEAINENARRLADIAVKGFDSPWFEYFRTEFPDLFTRTFADASSPEGAKAAAANLLKNFQDGLNPELIDKDTAKERVRRMLIGEAKMEELATEIANELAAEMGGVSLDQASNAARLALGLEDGATIKPSINVDEAAAQYAALGASAAKAFAGGAAGEQANTGASFLPTPPADVIAEQYGGLARSAFDAFGESARAYMEEANLGLEMTGILANQMTAKAALDQVGNAGRIQGATWANSFKETIGDIPDYIIDLIALRVVPKVEAAQNQQAQTTGAR